MQFGKILFACLIIILALGTASASQDMDNNLTNVCDEISIGDVSEEVSAESPDNITLNDTSQKEITADDFYVYTKKSLAVEDDDWSDPQIIVGNFPENGTLQVFVNKNLKFSRDVVAQKDKFVSLDIDRVKLKLGIKTEGIDYPISIKYVMKNKTVSLANYRFFLYSEDTIYINGVMEIKDSSFSASVRNPEGGYVVGTVKVTVNGKQVYSKKFKSSNKVRFLDILSTDISKNYAPGNYKVKVTFTSSGGKTYSSTRIVKFVNTVPYIDYPYKMSVGENQKITLESAKGSKGNLSLYQAFNNLSDDEDIELYVKGAKLLEVNVENGYASIPLDNLTEGEYKFIAEYDFDGYKNSKSFSIRVVKNSEGFSAKVSPSNITYGETVKVKVYGSKLNDDVDFYVDGQYVSSAKLKTGYASQILYGLNVGKHTVRVDLASWKNNFLKTFEVEVKKSYISLTLEKVIVKKSAGKLKINANLKIKDKVAKYKYVTFKFNKKTFKVKTNKNGIAKVTVPKKYLKNLKVGEKVTYHVSYDKVIIRKTAKVLK